MRKTYQKSIKLSKIKRASHLLISVNGRVLMFTILSKEKLLSLSGRNRLKKSAIRRSTWSGKSLGKKRRYLLRRLI